MALTKEFEIELVALEANGLHLCERVLFKDGDEVLSSGVHRTSPDTLDVSALPQHYQDLIAEIPEIEEVTEKGLVRRDVIAQIRVLAKTRQIHVRRKTVIYKDGEVQSEGLKPFEMIDPEADHSEQDEPTQRIIAIAHPEEVIAHTRAHRVCGELEVKKAEVDAKLAEATKHVDRAAEVLAKAQAHLVEVEATELPDYSERRAKIESEVERLNSLELKEGQEGQLAAALAQMAEATAQVDEAETQDAARKAEAVEQSQARITEITEKHTELVAKQLLAQKRATKAANLVKKQHIICADATAARDARIQADGLTVKR